MSDELFPGQVLDFRELLKSGCLLALGDDITLQRHAVNVTHDKLRTHCAST